MCLELHVNKLFAVAPFAGAWIEILEDIFSVWSHIVAPFAGAWIEIPTFVKYILELYVAPFAGAWIEIDKYEFGGLG